MASLNSRFKYAPLDPAIDCIRLLVIKPSATSGTNFNCSLQHVSFGERPRYEALSYTWGDQLPSSTKYMIFVDNIQFWVHENLGDALFQLRRDTLERKLWIDAICINQDDIQERNRQVRIMPHIYNRAECVLVWLGKFPTDVCSESYLGSPKILEDMCSRDYWNRVWIIQEIGKARRIQILVNEQSIDWDSFIASVKEFPTLADSVPLKLANGLLDKYGHGHRLHTLLSEHSQAMCKDPRDKIYGFIGLAIDCDSRFPIGYDKGHYEIWKDAVVYQSRNPMAQKTRIVEFACLMYNLLSRPEIGITREDLSDDSKAIEVSTETDDVTEYLFHLDINHPSSIMVPALLSGMIVYLGPTCEEIISQLEKVDEWTSSIKYYCPAPSLRNAYEENDQLLKLVEKMDSLDRGVGSFSKKVAHLLDDHSKASLDATHYQKTPGARHNPVSMERESDNYYTINNRLFIMDPGDYARCNSSATMGRAPQSAKVGDFICHFFAMSKAVVVRRDGDICKIVGTAVLGQNEVPYNRDKMDPGQPCVNIYLGLDNLYFNVI